MVFEMSMACALLEQTGRLLPLELAEGYVLSLPNFFSSVSDPVARV
ncbi:hypothetical protein [Treponema endosymbiont of Eucomonympha sp.]